MLFFAVPLRSKKTTDNWNKIENLFNRTLKSIYSQKDPDFKIIVACHEIPKVEFQTDKRLEFIQVDYDPPKNYREQMSDKFYKKRFIAKRVRELGSGHIMFVDSDDIVSNKISEFVNQNLSEPGWYLHLGYEYDTKLNKYRLSPKFSNLCGTCAIMKFDKEDLPTDVQFEGFEKVYDYNSNYPYIFDFPHNDWKTIYKNKKQPLARLPFIGAVYVINHGENVSRVSKTGFKRIILRTILPTFKSNRTIEENFTV